MLTGSAECSAVYLCSKFENVANLLVSSSCTVLSETLAGKFNKANSVLSLDSSKCVYSCALSIFAFLSWEFDLK